MIKVNVKDGDFVFSSPLARHRFMERAEGKEVRMDIHERPTNEMRKYFEGCLVPAFFYSHPDSGWDNFADAREALKLEFMPGVRQVRTLDGKMTRVSPSTTTLSKERFSRFVEAVVEWATENGMPYEILNSEEYLRWRDTNLNEMVYPPLQRLKEQYDKQKTT